MRELVFFHAEWCGVCHQKAPVVERIAEEHGLPLSSFDIESEEGAARAEELRVKQVPTLALVAASRVPFRLVGRLITPEMVRAMLERSG